MGWEKKRAAHEHARPGVLPEACGLLAQPIEHGHDGDGLVCRGHFRSGLCAVGCDGFACGVPAAVERIDAGLLACGFLSRPPVSELLVPALGLSGTADTDRGSPYGGMFMGVHHDLLCCLRAARCFCGVRSHQPTAW